MIELNLYDVMATALENRAGVTGRPTTAREMNALRVIIEHAGVDTVAMNRLLHHYLKEIDVIDQLAADLWSQEDHWLRPERRFAELAKHHSAIDLNESSLLERLTLLLNGPITTMNVIDFYIELSRYGIVLIPRGWLPVSIQQLCDITPGEILVNIFEALPAVVLKHNMLAQLQNTS